MSEVLIKGMEIPKNCAECKMWSICDCLLDFDDYESICNAVEDGDLMRDKKCPLVEVPTPHGRIGDLDKLKSKFRHGEGDSDVDSAWISTIRRFITQADTIIEAEGSDNE